MDCHCRPQSQISFPRAVHCTNSQTGAGTESQTIMVNDVPEVNKVNSCRLSLHACQLLHMPQACVIGTGCMQAACPSLMPSFFRLTTCSGTTRNWKTSPCLQQCTACGIFTRCHSCCRTRCLMCIVLSPSSSLMTSAQQGIVTKLAQTVSGKIGSAMPSANNSRTNSRTTARKGSRGTELEEFEDARTSLTHASGTTDGSMEVAEPMATHQ